jgi:hypothetical protein
VLTLFRNLLCIPDRLPTAASAADHLSHVKNELLGRFFHESVIEVLVLVAQVREYTAMKKLRIVILKPNPKVWHGATEKGP